MKVLDAPFTRDFIRTCNDGWLRGWHEANGGNLSYRLRKRDVQAVIRDLKGGPWEELPEGIEVPELGGKHIMVTASGSHFRDIAEDPERYTGIIQLSDDGKRMRKAWGFSQGGRPTSELASHLLALAAQKRTPAEDGKLHRVIYHCHPANLIALTFALPVDGESLTVKLSEMITECRYVIPNGLGMLGMMEPGSLELGHASIEALSQNDAVVWARHGLFCSAPTLGDAFGLAHTVEKASEILVKSMSMRYR